LGFKIEKRTPSDTPPREAASHVVTETPPSHGSTPYLALAPAPAPPADSHQGSTVVPGMFLAATKTRYDSEDKFDYKGKSEEGWCTLWISLRTPILHICQPPAPIQL
jgi:hypothetical protein